MAFLVAPPYNVPWWLAILAAVAGTTIIGLILGTLITRLHLPSFIVSLAFLIGLEGVMIWMFDTVPVAVGGVISVSNQYVLDLTSGNLSPLAGWVLMAALVVAFGSLTILRDSRRRKAGLVAPPFGLTAVKVLLAAIAGVVLVLVCNTNRGLHSVAIHSVVEGVPWAIPIIFGVLLAASFVLGRTRYGRYVYAIGGNPEAARRAGVNLALIRTVAFGISGLMAGIAGVIYTSWLSSIATDIDGGTYVLYAVAAAVIGGTSLFGGRGKPLHALLGGLVIAAIANGLALIGANAATTYMVTALVLIIAIVVDSVARRGQGASARGRV
jgi:D-xylose transport system permease protein